VAELVHYELYPLLALVLAAAIVAARAKGAVASAAAVGVAGVGLSAAFLVLGAPGLAAAQGLVGAVLVIVLVRAGGSSDAEGAGGAGATGGAGERGVAAALVFIGFMGAVLIPAFREILPFGRGVAPVFDAAAAFGQTGAANLVSAVLFGLRPVDALAAVAALFGAVVGVRAIVRGRDGDGDAGDEPDS